MSTSTGASTAPSLEDLLSGVHKKDVEESAAKPEKKSTSGKTPEITEEEENVGVTPHFNSFQIIGSPHVKHMLPLLQHVCFKLFKLVLFYTSSVG